MLSLQTPDRVLVIPRAHSEEDELGEGILEAERPVRRQFFHPTWSWELRQRGE